MSFWTDSAWIPNDVWWTWFIAGLCVGVFIVYAFILIVGLGQSILCCAGDACCGCIKHVCCGSCYSDDEDHGRDMLMQEFSDFRRDRGRRSKHRDHIDDF